MASIRIALLTSLLALIAACGSVPKQPPATVKNSSASMTNAMLAYNDNRYAEARTFFGRALMEYRSVDDLAGQGNALVDLADCALQQGDVPAVREYLAEAQTLVDQHQLAALAPRLALLAAYADLQAGDAEGATTRLDTLMNDAGTPADVRSAALFARTQAAFDQKAADSAQWLAKLNAAAGADKDPLAAARLARLQALAADSAKAAALYASALSQYQAAYYRPGIAATHEEWADLLLAQKDWAGARDHLRRALSVRLWMYDSSRSMRVLDKLATADKALGDDAAVKQDGELSQYLQDGGDPSQSLAKQPASH
ncbi:MAG: hypothetical protein ACHQAU_05830 [Gammaproteobacteria bacterium]